MGLAAVGFGGCSLDECATQLHGPILHSEGPELLWDELWCALWCKRNTSAPERGSRWACIWMVHGKHGLVRLVNWHTNLH